ncbi:MAG: DDE-type integrase/transposase/recombinase, partial [Rhodothermales bacterium]|nr:DDE-type integrase/transposase/recombinase [Rhodothermales bacterium]
LWTPWLPWALTQCWPFCWWVAVVMDRFSRRVMGVAVFEKQPTAVEVRHALDRVVRKCGSTPDHLITDRGRQFVARAASAVAARRAVCQPRGSGSRNPRDDAQAERLVSR